MAFRTDVSIDWSLSPRIIEVASPSASIVAQDLYDTLAILQARIYNAPYPRIVDGAGKTSLGAGVATGITVTLKNAKLKFEDRAGPGLTEAVFSGGTLAAVDENNDKIDAIQSSTNVFVVMNNDVGSTIITADSSEVIDNMWSKTVDDSGTNTMTAQDTFKRLLSWSAGRIVRDGDVFHYYAEDGTTLLYSYKITANERVRI